jgi:cellulose biosynthesis protein BcsQ
VDSDRRDPERDAARTYRVLTVTSNKGGVGKTTVAANLSVYIRALREDLPVLLLGLDDHRMLDRMFEFPPGAEVPSITEALRRGDLSPSIQLGQYGVHFVPSSRDVSELKYEIRDPFVLHALLRRAAWRGLVIVDTKSDLEILTRNAIAASDLAAIVVEDHLSIDEAGRAFDLMEEFGRPRDRARILLSLVDRRIKFRGEQSQDMLTFLRSEVEQRGYPSFETFISRSPKIQSLYTNPEGRPHAILHGAKGSAVHRQMHSLACEVLELLGDVDFVSTPEQGEHTAAPRSESRDGAAAPEAAVETPAAGSDAVVGTSAAAPEAATGEAAPTAASLPVPFRAVEDAETTPTSGYRLTRSGTHWEVAEGERLLDRLRARYRDYFEVVFDPVTNRAPDMRPLLEDLGRTPVDKRNFEALNAIAIGFFEISYRAEAQRGSGLHYMGQSFRAAKVAAVLWRAYGDSRDFRLRDAIIDFFEDAATGEKLGSRTTARTLAQMVASIQRQEQDPARLKRLHQAWSALRHGSGEGHAGEHRRGGLPAPPRPARAARSGAKEATGS